MLPAMDQTRQHALGGLLHTWRASLGLSSLAMAQHVGIAHSTWRALEAGNPARPRTYAAVEKAAELPQGMIYRALADDEVMTELAAKLGIEPEEGQSMQAFLASFALPVAWSQQLAPTKPAQPDDVGVATQLLSRLTARQNRTAVESAALSAVYALIAEWAGISGDD